LLVHVNLFCRNVRGQKSVELWSRCDQRVISSSSS
jgi:hypothetical protein